MIKVSVKGDWSKTDIFLERCLNLFKAGKLNRYGERGVDALKAATPRDTGITADSWYYNIVPVGGGLSIQWLNSSQNQGISIVILVQYGHGLHNGGYVEGVDFINPALKPVFDEIADDLWKELTNG